VTAAAAAAVAAAKAIAANVFTMVDRTPLGRFAAVAAAARAPRAARAAKGTKKKSGGAPPSGKRFLKKQSSARAPVKRAHARASNTPGDCY